MQADVTAAIRARDKVTASVLRTTLTALANAEAVDASGSASALPVPGLYATEAARRTLSDDDVRGLITAEHDDLQRAAAEMQELGQHDTATRLTTQADILAAYVAMLAE
jgi:uncharacterized protein